MWQVVARQLRSERNGPDGIRRASEWDGSFFKAMLAQFLSAPQYVIIWFIKPMNTILVGGLEHALFFHILGISSSQLTKSYFSEG